jgi:hypothetical protein
MASEFVPGDPLGDRQKVLWRGEGEGQRAQQAQITFAIQKGAQQVAIAQMIAMRPHCLSFARVQIAQAPMRLGGAQERGQIGGAMLSAQRI